MSGFTIGWIGLAVCALVLEGVALFNSKKGDTLSEHLWALFGIRGKLWNYHRGVFSEKWANYDQPVTPVWTLRVVRTLGLFFITWLIAHIVTGGQV